MRKLRRFTDSGEMTVILSALGAIVTGVPLAVVLNGAALGDAVLYLGALSLALGAIGVAVGRVWRMVRFAVLELDRLEGMATRIDANGDALDAIGFRLDDIDTRLKEAGH